METKYKDSGIPWIGLIPEHWEVKRGKSILREVHRDVRPDDGVVTCFRDGEVTLRINRRTTGFTESDKEIGYHGVRVGDLVIHQMDAFAGSIGISDSDGKCSPICIVCQPLHDNEIYLDYLCLALRIMADRGFIQSLATGIRERSTDFRYKTLVTLLLPVPPLTEQKQIVEYLNNKCGEIDELIEVEKQMITYLESYRQSVITETVTHGLNPDVPTKESTIQGVGNIPITWDEVRFKSVFTTRKGLSITKADLVESGIPVISYGQIHSKQNNGTTICRDMLKYVPTTYLLSDSNSLVNKGDFIFADTSEDISGCGNCAYIDADGNIFAGYHAIIASGDNIEKYFAYLFLTDSWRSQIRSRVSGIKVFSISQSILSETKIIVPPIIEQREIADYLDAKCAEIDDLIKVKQEKIETLKQYRQSLIFEAVTGKAHLL